MAELTEPEMTEAPRPRPVRWDDSPEALYALRYRSDHWGSWPHEYGPRDDDAVAAGVHRPDCRGCSLISRLDLAEGEVESWYQKTEEAEGRAMLAIRRAERAEALLALAEPNLVEATNFRAYDCRDHGRGLHGIMCRAFEEYERAQKESA